LVKRLRQKMVISLLKSFTGKGLSINIWAI
jgi:hypothetical protein